MTIRSNINLNKLKKSGIPKLRKIYEKACKIKTSGYIIPEICEEAIYEIASKYTQLKVSTSLNGDIVNVRSKCDKWMAVKEDSFYTLYHEELEVKNSKFIYSYHIQDIFLDLDFLLASIISHDEYKMMSIENGIEGIREITNEAIENKIVC